MRKSLGMAILAGLLVSGTTTTASAAPPDEGPEDCPRGFQELSVAEVIDMKAPQFPDTVFEEADVNNDGILCVRIEGKNPRFAPEVTFLFADNKKGIGRPLGRP